MKRIAIDMDQVMADLIAKFLTTFNAQYNTHYTKEDLYDKRLPELDPHAPEALARYYEDPTFFRDFPLFDGAIETIARLGAHYEIFIATAAMDVPSSFQAKFEWLQEHFPAIPKHHYVFCGDKSVVHADYLIDDTELQLTRFTGTGVMFAAPHNERSTFPVRLQNWAEVERYFMDELTKSN